ncbi:MAG: HAMP domain-containing sensor histidine kinase [Lentimicrobiaceae bacterium]|nr:HAMP domain-containing sensor histidine kinase [Lentimicrobiaceae bacterium]
MNQKLIVFITIMVSLALLVLTAIQAYWINGAIKLREADFNRTVAEAVGDVMQRFEHQEMMLEMKKNSEYNNLMRSVDSLDYLIYQETGSYPGANRQSGFNYQRQQEWSSVFEDNQWKMVKKSDSALMTLPEADSLASTTKSKTKMPELSARAKALSEKKRFLLNQLFNDFFSTPFRPNIENRLSKGQLDTLISQSFTARGIKTDYEFGIFSEARNIMVIESNPELRNELMKEGMFFPIFSRAGHVANDFLLLYFPNQTRYLIIQMGGMLIVSAVLLLLIVVSFAIVIAAIFRQKKLSEMKNDFINNMTHELKTPISTVSLACEVLNDPDIARTDDIVNSYIDIIDQENKRLGVLVEKVLRTAILEKGQLNLKAEPLDLHAIIRDVIRKISIQVEIRDGRITSELKAEESVIYADKMHITNVINNLLDNANKYTPKRPLIHVTTENMDGGIWVRITDNGVGISKTNQKKIFEKLYRVPTGDVHDVKGFGLGLSYVKFIVEKHEGEIGVDSEPGKGSTFRVWLPLAPME